MTSATVETAFESTLDALARTRREEVRAANDRLVLIAEHLAARPPQGPDDVTVEHDPCLIGDRSIPLAGEGAPEVSEFAVMELGPVLGMSLGGVRRLTGDVVELASRLPKVWARVRDYTVEGWRARQVADQTKLLSLEAAAWVDAQIAPVLHRRGRVTVGRLVEQALAMFDPESAAIAAEELADQFSLRIELDAPTLFDEDLGRLGSSAASGHAYAEATMDLADAADLENAIAAIAKALGELARAHTAGGAGSGTARVLNLYGHVDRRDLRGTGLVSVDNLGAVVSIEQIDEWAQAPGTVVRPVKVIDLNTEIAGDGYVPPRAQHEQAVLISGGTCVYPGCTRSAWLADTDHIEAHAQGGRTTSRNLAKLCRSHHRLKTHGGWSYVQTSPGTFLWQAPDRTAYVRYPDGTFEQVTRRTDRGEQAA